MFLPDDTPILFKLPRDKEYADIYFIHDLRYGSELFNAKKWNNLKAQIIADPNAYICWVGDLMEDAIPNSKSDICFILSYSDWFDFGSRLLLSLFFYLSVRNISEMAEQHREIGAVLLYT